VLAVMVSVFIFKEPLSLAAFIGIVMILGAVLTIALHHEKPAAEQSQIQ